MKLKNDRQNYQGFTLWEGLLGLLVLSLSVLLFSSLLINAQYFTKQLENTETKTWNIFLLQLANERQEFLIQNITTNKITFFDPEKQESFSLEFKQNKLVKSKNNGYQPLLVEVKMANFEQFDSAVLLTVRLSDDKIRQSYIVLDERIQYEK